MMRAFSVVLVVMTAFLLVGCGDYTTYESRDADGKLYNGAKTIDEAAGVFWRVEASYRVKETGERLDFNYVVSAFNRDVVGSYSGEFFPKVVFKKTKNNAVLAVDAPVYYHNYGFERPPSFAPSDPIPRITWYPDADDKRYAESYVTSDAYHSPRAAIEFIDYKVTQVTREDSKVWWAHYLNTRDETQTYISPQNCEEERDADFFGLLCRGLKYSGLSTLGQHKLRSQRMARPDPTDAVSVVTWPQDALELYKEFRVSKKRYVCHNDEVEPLIAYRKLSTVKVGEKERRLKIQKIRHKLTSASRRQRGEIWYTGAKRSKATALGLSKDVEMFGSWNKETKTRTPYFLPVTAFYPVVRYEHPKPETDEVEQYRPKYVMQIVTQPEWKGFALPTVLPITDISDEFKAPIYEGGAYSALFLDDELVCEVPYSNSQFLLYDLDLGRTIAIENEL